MRKRGTSGLLAALLLAGSWVLLKPLPALADGNMILVPAGVFTMGLTEAQLDKVKDLGGSVVRNANATPAHKVNLPAYYIDKYEVTNEDYKKFVDAAKHTHPEHWEGGKIPAGKGKHPVVFVTLSDARAYAKWAGKRLPSEAEWEKGARGTDGRLFPWGNRYKRRHANTDEARKGGTTPVGSFEKGKSPYGVYDMAGNVWEWTTDNYLPYPGTKHEDEFFGKERYVVRGGSWYDLKSDAITAARSKFTAPSADETLGFRCAKDAK